MPIPAEESRTQTPARQAPVSRSATGGSAWRCAARRRAGIRSSAAGRRPLVTAAVRSALPRTGTPPAETMRSPRRNPAAFAGFSAPRAVYWSEKATMSAPSASILTPNGAPLTRTVRRAACTVRTVLTGSTPNRRSVVFWLPPVAVLAAGAAASAAGAPACRNGSEASVSGRPGSRYSVSGTAARSAPHAASAAKTSAASAPKRRFLRCMRCKAFASPLCCSPHSMCRKGRKLACKKPPHFLGARRRGALFCGCGRRFTRSSRTRRSRAAGRCRRRSRAVCR